MGGIAVDRERAAIYAPFVLEAAPRLLGQLDRERHSASYGSFDRDHWGWKFRDFPILMTQWAVLPVALLARLEISGSPYLASQAMFEWARAALRSLCDRQHPSGAWDTVGPNNQDHGGALASSYYLVETARALGDELDDADRARVTDCIERAMRFAGRSREDHAFVSNHQALFALGWLAASEWLDDAASAGRAAATIDGILAHQHADGFYEEYGGFDPGYETLGIQYLARYWARTRDARLLDSLRRAVAFFSHALHPDGSVGGAYGSRHTRLYFPAGFEILASELPEAAGIAAFVRGRLARGEVVTPTTVDAHNAYVVTLSYLQACCVTTKPREARPPPCESLRGERRFECGLVAVGTDQYYAVAALQKGGVLRVHTRSAGSLVYEDAGWVVRRRGRVYASQHGGASDPGSSDSPDAHVTRAHFSLVAQEQLTPLRFLLLRVLNLTLFRSVAVGSWVRRRVVARLITRVVRTSAFVERRLGFRADRVDVHDTLHLTPLAPVDAVELARAFTGIHMGSAKYFHPSELVPVPRLKPTRGEGTTNGSRALELRFSVVWADGAAEVSTPPTKAAAE